VRVLWQRVLGWWRAHRGGIAAAVVASVIVVILLGSFHAIPIPGLDRGNHDHPQVQTSPPPTDAPGPVITSVTLPAKLERDPPGHKLRTVPSSSSAEFFGGRLVVSSGAIRPLGSGEWALDRLVIRSMQGGHCDLPGLFAGSAWELIDESGHGYRVDLRGLDKGRAGFVAYTSQSTAGDHPGPSRCLALYAKPLP